MSAKFAMNLSGVLFPQSIFFLLSFTQDEYSDDIIPYPMGSSFSGYYLILISLNLFWVLFSNLFSFFSFLWLDQDYYIFNPNWKWKFSYCLKHLSSTISQIIDDLSHIQLKLFSIFIVIYV